MARDTDDHQRLFAQQRQESPGQRRKGIDDGRSVFRALLRSDLPLSEKALQRMTEEGFSLFAAGTETVSWALIVVTYHLLAKPELLDKAKAELSQVIDSSGQLPDWTALEKLPYLGAVVRKGLRLSYGLATWTARAPLRGEVSVPGKIGPGRKPVADRAWLHETTEADAAYDHDFFNPFLVRNSKGVRAVIV
ncbi:cytochrome P450 [Colletotrichum plurivorum]|uniref:Cytochrome P450 n=1 Tax=Colletotrichum plurivorum TaxID=2175906 RepID=A0A8H6K4L9_9PEZI|nr:cytochrome P450 [Colletotrichum plurivorum]